MKKVIALVALIAFLSSFITSCSSRYITTYEAANGKARCGRIIR